MPVAWEYWAVAFLDVLGFANFVEEDGASIEPKHLEKLRMSLQEARDAAPETIDVRAFSDSIILATPLGNQEVTELIESVVSLQRIFVQRGVLIRGAIAFGKHYADADLVYSQGLVLAYRQERDFARFPRILVDENLLNWFLNDPGTTAELRERVNALLMRDRDNRVFLNYLHVDLLGAHLSILTSYEIPRVTASVLEKVQWLAAYHNHVAAALDATQTFDGPLLQGFRAA